MLSMIAKRYRLQPLILIICWACCLTVSCTFPHIQKYRARSRSGACRTCKSARLLWASHNKILQETSESSILQSIHLRFTCHSKTSNSSSEWKFLTGETQFPKTSGRHQKIVLLHICAPDSLAGDLPVQDFCLQKDSFGLLSSCPPSQSFSFFPVANGRKCTVEAAAQGPPTGQRDGLTSCSPKLVSNWVLVKDIVILTPDCHPRSQGIS